MDPFSATSLLSATAPYAAAAVFLVLLIESALPVAFVLPGDTLLLTAGLACATGHLPLPWMLGAAVAGAVLGAQGGYLLGRLGQRALLPGPHNRHIRRAVVRFEHLAGRRGYGPALIAARFIPVARSIAGPISGLLRIPTARFTAWQAAGALVWTHAVTLAGYGIGRAAPGLERFVPLFLLLAALSFPITAALGYLLVRVRSRRLLARPPDRLRAREAGRAPVRARADARVPADPRPAARSSGPSRRRVPAVRQGLRRPGTGGDGAVSAGTAASRGKP